ncbi:hypothetical protein GF325_03865 [Candidatus Bathyarchaeota archaeon]|nr:hypothetical protein [Candidatus Bathyarchaeota archaeon]
MHVNTHFATSVVIAILLEIITPVTLSWWELMLAILAGCAPDADYIITSRAKNGNHRWLATHSIFPGLILTTIAGIFLVFEKNVPTFWWMLLITGVNAMVHVLLDSLDWGANLFLRDQLEGLKLLMEGKTDDQVTQEMDRSPSKNGYFFMKYYSSKFFQAYEIAIFSLMTSILIFRWSRLGIILGGGIFALYFIMLSYHLRQVMVARQLADQS